MRITALFTSLALCVGFSSTAYASSAMAGDPQGMIVAAPVIHQTAYRVTLNKSELVRLPTTAAAIIVGNPDIADVTVHSQDTIFIVGRGYGDTNVIILNSKGETVMDATISVVGTASQKSVRVYNGSASMRSTYNCSPYCQPSPVLGDDVEFIGNNTPQDTPTVNTFAGGGSISSAQSLGVAAEISEGLAATSEPNVADPRSN